MSSSERPRVSNGGFASHARPLERSPFKSQACNTQAQNHTKKALFNFNRNFNLARNITNNNNLAILSVICFIAGCALAVATSATNGPRLLEHPATLQYGSALKLGAGLGESGAELAERHQGDHHSTQPQVVHKSPLNGRQFGDSINDIQIECNANSIVVTLQTSQGFNGMIYPKGLSKNSSCMTEYHQLASNITYYLPLKSCNTMSADVEDGIEYFNTVMVQPHRRLVTNQGRGYHIRCRYQTRERVITNQDQQLSVNMSQSTPAVMGNAQMPSCTMRIYSANDLSHEVSAENVRIGDELQLVISLDDQDVYGMLVTNCLVRDGMNWGEQPLIDDFGCPVDEEIMAEFNYAANLTRASVTFQAHKFPYTSSVYYQCNVRLCFRDSGGCAQVPPDCRNRPSGGGSKYAPASNQLDHHQTFNGNNYKSSSAENELTGVKPTRSRGTGRSRRWVDAGELDGVASEEVLREAARPHSMTIEVSSGLHVAETRALEPSAAALSSPREGGELSNGADPLEAAAATDDEAATDAAPPPVAAEKNQQQQRSEREFCMSLRKFAIIISLISLLLMTAIIIMMACLIQRRNRRKMDAQMHQNFDHEQHHTNRAYRRD